MGISTHVLDTVRGRPAVAVPVRLQVRRDEAWGTVAAATTDADGRVPDLSGGAPLEAGEYRLRFDTAAYLGDSAFYPEVVVTFRVDEPGEHHHIPLLLSAFGYTTYRGS